MLIKMRNIKNVLGSFYDAFLPEKLFIDDAINLSEPIDVREKKKCCVKISFSAIFSPPSVSILLADRESCCKRTHCVAVNWVENVCLSNKSRRAFIYGPPPPQKKMSNETTQTIISISSWNAIWSRMLRWNIIHVSHVRCIESEGDSCANLRPNKYSLL